MSAFGAVLKIAGIAGLLSMTAPIQVLCLKCGWKLSRRLPFLVHRSAARILGIRVTVSGEAPGRRPALVVSNHVSWIDIVVLSSLQPASFIAKSEIERWPVFGVLAKLQNSIFIDRTRRKATAEVNDAIAQRLADGEAIILFAEGTTGDGNYILPFRSSLVGAAHAALSQGDRSGEPCDIAIKPLAITYTRRNGLPITRRDRPKIAWYGDMELVPHLWAILRDGPLDVAVHWGDSIPLGSGIDRKAATAIAHDVVRQSLRR